TLFLPALAQSTCPTPAPSPPTPKATTPLTSHLRPPLLSSTPNSLPTLMPSQPSSQPPLKSGLHAILAMMAVVLYSQERWDQIANDPELTKMWRQALENAPMQL